MNDIFKRVQLISKEHVKQQSFNFSEIIGSDDIVQLQNTNNSASEPRMTVDKVKAVFDADSDLGKSISAEEEKKSSSSYSIIDSNSNSTPL